MGLLSLLASPFGMYGGDAMRRIPGVTPFVQPQQSEPGPMGAPFAMPQPPPKPQQPRGFMSGLQGFGQRLQTATESPLFQIGMSLLGNAQGSNWQGVGQDVRSMNEGYRERQLQDNELRRQKTSDAREGQQFDWLSQDRTRQTAQRQSLDQWVSGLPSEQQAMARANPEMAYEAYMQTQMAANAPITPYQQAQLDLQRRELDLDAQRLRQQEQWTPVGADRTQINRVESDAISAGEALYLADQFEAANRRTGSGYGTNLIPWHGFGNDDIAAMDQISSMIQTMTAPQGQGAVSNYERDLFSQSSPSVSLTGDQNAARLNNFRTLMRIRQERAAFFGEYGQRKGNLRGVEQAFEQSPQFLALLQEHRSGSDTNNDATTFPTLPSPNQYDEGQGITDDETGQRFVIRNGQWVRRPATPPPGGAPRPGVPPVRAGGY